MNKFNIGQLVYFLPFNWTEESIHDINIDVIEISEIERMDGSVNYSGEGMTLNEDDLFASEEALKQFIKEKLNIE